MVKRKTLNERAYKNLLNRILNFKFKPGEKIIEEKLSRQLNVSRTPLREALRRLEKEGFIENISRRGCYVKKMSAEEMLKIYEIREVLEGLGARLASGKISPEKFKELEKIVKEMGDCIKRDDYVKYNERDLKFHKIIISESGNPLLEQIMERFSLQTKSFFINSKTFPSKLKERRALKEYKQIINSLKNGSPVLAEKVARRHIRNAIKNFKPSKEE